MLGGGLNRTKSRSGNMILPLLLLFLVIRVGVSVEVTVLADAVQVEEQETQELVCSVVDGSCHVQSNDELETALSGAGSSASLVSCEDVDSKMCTYLAGRDECAFNPTFMKTYCQKSCRLCKDTSMKRLWQSGVDLGHPQQLDDPSVTVEQVEARLQVARAHSQQYSETITCRNHHEFCAIWSLGGECERNPSWMKHHCAPVCQSCGELQILLSTEEDLLQEEDKLDEQQLQQQIRCPIDPTWPNAWEPGSLDLMFRRIIQDYADQGLKILSSPENGGPWVVMMDDFLSADEAQRLIALGTALGGYERSLNNNGKDSKGRVSTIRTSLNAWCIGELCEQDPVVRNIMERMERLTGIPENNGEYLQLLKYDPGTFYTRHNDYALRFRETQFGVRILTVFLYLNTVEAGGETNFPDLDISVQPIQGRLLMWPSVLNEDPHTVDDRTSHQAMLVEQGLKYAANAFIHMRDYRTPFHNGCIP